MNKIISTLFLATLLISAGCSSSTSKSSTDAPSVYSSDIEEAALAAAQTFVRDLYASDAKFNNSQVSIEPTEVAGRYKIMQRFDSEQRDGYNFVYRIWLQKFPAGWEFGNLGIERAGGERVLTTNGRMKEMEQKDGVGDKLSVAGIEFTIAEKKPTVIRIYTDKKLSRGQLRSVIEQLMSEYESIQFATDASHERGDEYASWTSDMFFDYDADEIIGKANFFK